jgi:hypothetical protein
MNTILKQLYRLGDNELLSLSEAIDSELDRRLGRQDDVPDSARRRAISREHSYHHSTGSSAPPIRAVGLRRQQRAA